MNGLPEILQFSQDALFLNFIVFLRVGPVIALFPGFGEETVPVRIKLVLVLAFTVIVAASADIARSV